MWRQMFPVIPVKYTNTTRERKREREKEREKKRERKCVLLPVII